MKIIINIIFFGFFFLYNSCYIFSLNDTFQTEKKQLDSLDSQITINKDSIKLFEPLKFHGSISNNKIQPYFIISKDSILFSDYTSLSDIFLEKLLIYPLHLGNYSNLNSLSILGGLPNNLSFRYNDRIISDFQYPLFNFEIFPVENFEKIEIFTGSDAVIFSENSSSALINFQEKIYNTSKPYTKIWFSQAAYDFLASDGIFSQNFMPNVNFSFGFRRMSVKGRFDNTWMDSWNLRGGLRWNINEKTNISLVDIFTNHGQGTNGGIDKTISRDIFDELIANPRYNELNERVFKHDLTLTLTSIFNDNQKSDTSEKNLNQDNSDWISSNQYQNSDLINSSLYFSHSEWNQKRQPELFLNENDSIIFTKNYSVLIGLNTSLDLSLVSWLSIKTGAEISYLKIDKGVYYSSLDNLKWSAYGYFSAEPFSDKITLSGGIRTGISNKFYFLNAGTKLLYKFNKYTDFLIDLSKFDRSPSPTEGFDLSKETGILAFGSFKRRTELFDIISEIFYRNIHSPVIANINSKDNIIQDILFINEDNLTSYGLSLSLKFSLIKNLYTRIKVVLQKYIVNDNPTDILPLFYPTFDTYYEFSRGRSYVRLGLNAAIIPSHKGMSFNPIRRSYVFNNNLSETEQDLSPIFFNGINIYGSARLGTVYVNISLQNIISADYYYIKFYPMYDRNLRISLHWAFDN